MYDVCGVYGVLVSVVPLVCMVSVVSRVSWTQGCSQKSGDGGANFYRKPHLLSNAKTGSNYFSVGVPAIHILSNNNEHVDELGVTVK